MKSLLTKIISVLLMIESVFHFVFPTITLYSMYVHHIWHWEIALTPIADLFFGVVCSLGSYLLGTSHHHHHHKEED